MKLEFKFLVHANLLLHTHIHTHTLLNIDSPHYYRLLEEEETWCLNTHRHAHMPSYSMLISSHSKVSNNKINVKLLMTMITLVQVSLYLTETKLLQRTV